MSLKVGHGTYSKGQTIEMSHVDRTTLQVEGIGVLFVKLLSKNMLSSVSLAMLQIITDT